MADVSPVTLALEESFHDRPLITTC